MKTLKKIFKSVFSKALYHSIGIGGLAIIAATVIAFYSLKDKADLSPLPATTAYNIQLPEDNEMLIKLAKELEEGADVGEEAKNLSDIAPAAGDQSLPRE